MRSVDAYAGCNRQVLAFDGVAQPFRQVGDTDISFCDRRLSGTPVHSAITPQSVFYRRAGRPATGRYAGLQFGSELGQPLYRGNCFSGLSGCSLSASSAGTAPVLSCSDLTLTLAAYPPRHLRPATTPLVFCHAQQLLAQRDNLPDQRCC